MKASVDRLKVAAASAASTVREKVFPGKKEWKHKFLLVPMTSKTVEIRCCRRWLVNKYNLESDIVREVVAKETIEDAMRVFVPAKPNTSEVTQEHDLCCCCCCGRACCRSSGSPGYDFLFNQQQFQIVSVVFQLLLFCSFIMLNHERYFLPPPSCSALQLDGSLGPQSNFSLPYNHPLLNPSASVTGTSTSNLTRANVSMVGRSDRSDFVFWFLRCNEVWRAMDPVGVCVLLDAYLDQNIVLSISLLALTIYIATSILEQGKRFSVHTRRSGDCQCVSPRYYRRSMCSLLLSVLRVHSLVLVAILKLNIYIGWSGVALNLCYKGMNQRGCFATNSVGDQMIFKTKGELQQHYQGMVYFQKWPTPAFKQLLPVMEINWDTCQKFHRDGNTQVVFLFLWVYRAMSWFVGVWCLALIVDSCKPGAVQRLYACLWKRISAWWSTCKIRFLRGAHTAAYASSRRRQRKLPSFKYPAIVIVALLVTALALGATSIKAFKKGRYWSTKWAAECLAPAARSAYSVASNPLTTNTSMLVNGIFAQCYPLIDTSQQLHTLHESKTFFEDVVLKKVYAISNATTEVGKKLVIDGIRLTTMQNEPSTGMFEAIVQSLEGEDLAEQVIRAMKQAVFRRFDVYFYQVKAFLANDVWGRIVIGTIISTIIDVWASFYLFVFVVCVVLRFRSIWRMMNKLHAVGLKQRNVVERCFDPESGTYVFPMTQRDLRDLMPVYRKQKQAYGHFHFLDCWSKAEDTGESVDHWDDLTTAEQVALDENRCRRTQNEQLRYRYIQDINYFFPTFVVSQLLSALIQYFCLWWGLTVGFFALVVWATDKVLVSPEGDWRTFSEPHDIDDALRHLYSAIVTTLLVFILPGLLKLATRCYQSSFVSEEGGIRDPQRFVAVSYVQVLFLLPITVAIMVWRIISVLSKAFYLLGDMDKPFGYFDTPSYGWRSLIEFMRIRAEYEMRAYVAAKEIRRKHASLCRPSDRPARPGTPSSDSPSSVRSKRHVNSWLEIDTENLMADQEK